MKPYTEPTPKDPPLLSIGYKPVCEDGERYDVECAVDRVGRWFKERFSGHGVLVFLVGSAIVALCVAAFFAILGGTT